jgi:hypothetical protein
VLVAVLLMRALLLLRLCWLLGARYRLQLRLLVRQPPVLLLRWVVLLLRQVVLLPLLLRLQVALVLLSLLQLVLVLRLWLSLLVVVLLKRALLLLPRRRTPGGRASFADQLVILTSACSPDNHTTSKVWVSSCSLRTKTPASPSTRASNRGATPTTACA